MSGGRLAGRTIVVTRARRQAADLASLLIEEGAEVLEFPVIATVDPPDWAPADAAIADLASYDWVVFTSANAVEAFLGRLAGSGLGPEAMDRASLAAVGPATASRLEHAGVSVAVVPDEHRAEGVLESLAGMGVGAGTRVLLPRALEAREVLPEELRARGAVVDVVPVYRTVRGEGNAETDARLRAGGVDAITFTSASTVRHFLALLADPDPVALLRGVLLASIGPVTSKELASAGLIAGAEARASTVPDLVDAIVAGLGAEPTV